MGMPTDLDVCCQRSWITRIQIPFVFWIVRGSRIEARRALKLGDAFEDGKSERNQTGGAGEGGREAGDREGEASAWPKV